MGSGVVNHCSECDDYKEYTLGVGMMFSELGNIIHLFSPTVKRQITTLQCEKSIENTDFSYELFECSHCDSVHSRLNLEIAYNDDKVFTASYRCYECTRILKITEREIETFKCRKCGNRTLKELPGGYLWD